MRARERYWRLGVVPALVLSLAGASEAGAQVTVVGQQDLAFGVVVPGTPAVVPVNDAARRGEWLLTGRGNTTISFVLPAALAGPGGATMPLVFGAGDAAIQRQGGGIQTTDPRTPFSVNVPNRQTMRLLLGGTAQPTTAQPAGGYTATITVIVAQP